MTAQQLQGLLVLLFGLCARGERCDVTKHNVDPDSTAVQTQVINAVLSKSHCDEVVFPAPHTFITGTLRLPSHTVITVETGATVQAAPPGGQHFLIPPDNPWSVYQDYGHSHWEDALLFGDNVVNLTVQGGGTISGTGSLVSSDPNHGDADKMWGFKGGFNVTLQDLTFEGGGWFTILATNVSGLTLHRLAVTACRDGFDIVGCRHVSVDQVNIQGGGDDAMVFKSDYSLGAVLHSFDLVVTNSVFACGCNGLNFGSETVGDFSDVRFENISVVSAGKAGIGIVSMDGSHISNVRYKNITIRGAYTPFYFYIGNRLRRPDAHAVAPGSISNISVSEVHAKGGGYSRRRRKGTVEDKGNVTAVIDGQPNGSEASFFIGPGIDFANVTIEVPGGGAAEDAERDPPHPDVKYPPRYLGVRPAYGWFLRRLKGASFRDVRLSFDEADARPAFVLDDVHDVVMDRVCAEPGVGTEWDVVLRNGSDVYVDAPAPACDHALRIQPLH